MSMTIDAPLHLVNKRSEIMPTMEDVEFPEELESKRWSRESDVNPEAMAREDSKLMRRVDWRLLPWICVLYALSLIDRYILYSRETNGRNNIGGASIAGMETELQMENNNSYSVSLLVFFPGYSTHFGPS